jgi:hypothetical protein
MYKNEAKTKLINLCPSVTFNVLLTSVFLVGFSCFSFAQNVGIGVDDPSTKLDVDGVITGIGGNSTEWNSAYAWGNHNLAGYLLNELDPKVGSLGEDFIPRWNGLELSNGSIKDNGASVGIGGEPSNEKLYVAGRSFFNENIGIGGPPLGDDTTRLFVNGSSFLKGYLNIQKDLSLSGGMNVSGISQLFGNVGIGTFANNNKLFVLGASRFDGNSTTSGTSELIGNVGIGGSPRSEKLYVAGTSYLRGNIGIGITPTLTERLNVEGNTKISGNVGIGSSPNINRLYVNGSSYFQGNSTTTGSSVLLGNVGIGAPANSNRLYVGGTVGVNGSSSLLGNVGIGSPPNENRLYVNGTANISGPSQLSGNVGIGVPADPTYKLYVLGNTFNAGNTVATGTGYYNGSVGIGTPPTANKLQVNGNTRIDGNVGLGKAPDAVRLDINGSIRISGAALKPGGGSWTNSSDRRLKKDIIPYEDGLNEILQIEAVNFKYNELSGYDTNQAHVGVIT